MIAGHLLVLLVVLPLMAAPIAFLLPGGRWSWLVATLTSWAVLGLAIAILLRVMAAGELSYALGGWAPPWGIEYRVDVFNALVALIVAAMAAAILPYALASVERDVAAHNHNSFYAAFLLALCGLLGITLTADVFNLFVFLEISSLSSYLLVSQGRDRAALLAAFRYLVMGTIGATFLLVGIGLLYAMTGTLNMPDLAQRIPEVQNSRAVHTAFAFIVVGLGIKLAVFPLHQWLPDAYAQAPAAVSAFLAATATKVALYVLARFLFTVFGAEFSFGVLPLKQILLPLAVAGVLVGSVLAILQSDIKRMLAYSSIAQIGYMVLGLGLASAAGISAATLHLFNHALMKAALFMAVGCVVWQSGVTRIEQYAGLGRRMPWTMAGFVLAGLSLVGVPLTVGFISKWYLFVAAIAQQAWLLVAVLVAGSLLALVYIGRVVEVAYFRAGADDRVQEAPWTMLLPLWLMVLANIYFGINARFTVGLAERAGALLWGAGL